MAPGLSYLSHGKRRKDAEHPFVRLTAVLCALLRSAVRTDAHQVRIEWDDRSGTLSIEDDGEGMDIAQGTFLCDFSATFLGRAHVDIESRDWKITRDANSDPPEALRVVQSARVGMRVALRLHRTAWPTGRGNFLRDGEYAVVPETSAVWRAMLIDLTRGFPIPVFFQGNALPRPHAITGTLTFRDCELGQLHLHNAARCEPDSLSRPPFLYSEGLPLMPQRRVSECAADVMHVARRHVEETVDAHALASRAQAVRLDAWKQRLRERYGELDLPTFAELHWRTCVEAAVPQFLTDAPLTASMLSIYDAPITALWTDARRTTPWRDRALPGRDALLIEPLTRDYFGDGFDPPAPLASLYAVKRTLPVLDPRVPSAHWARSRAVDLLDPALALRYGVRRELARAPFNGRWVQCDVVLCRAIEISFAPTTNCAVTTELRALLTPLTVSDLAFYKPTHRWIVIPIHAENAGDVIAQAASFRDDNEHFHEWIFERDDRDLRCLVADLRKRATQRPRAAPEPQALESQSTFPRRARSA